MYKGNGSVKVTPKAKFLKVPRVERNGNTYATLTNFFDKRAGRDSFKRPEGGSVKWKKSELNYAWIHQNIIQKQSCIACHGDGAKQDFSSYEKLLKVINLKQVSKSHILGMIQTNSMPPFPMPTVPKEMQKALGTWIKMGAPK